MIFPALPAVNIYGLFIVITLCCRRFEERMRILCVLICLWISLGEVAGRAVPKAQAEVQMFGQAYVELSHWAVARQFKLQWITAGEDLCLSNRWARLDFKVDSSRTEINGIAVWLSHPIAARNDAAYISKIDLQTVIQPLLFPSKSLKRPRLRTVAVDPGHGGKDPGNQEGKYLEKRHTLLLAQEVRQRLLRAGLKVVLTRSSDKFVDLSERTALAKRRGAEVFVSLHYNSTQDQEAGVSGVESYCLTPTGAKPTNDRSATVESKPLPGNHHDAANISLAYQVQKTIVRRLRVEDRGVRRANFAVLRMAQMPAVLIECGFMSNPAEAKRIYTASYRRLLAQAIVDGLLAYKRLVER
jgi:N-acetylmuramoyl-L-alanine amidase